jgi:hypothetical protein
MKWFTSFVFPGVWEVFASFELEQSMLIREDLPTFDRPMKANSGSRSDGFWLTLVEEETKRALTIFILAYFILCKDNKLF